MTLIIGVLLIVQIYLLGYTYQLPESIMDTNFHLLPILQYLAVGCTLGYLFKSYKQSNLKAYVIISIPLLFLATFRWIFLNETIMNVLKNIISFNFVNIMFVHSVYVVSWLALGGLLYLIVVPMFKGRHK